MSRRLRSAVDYDGDAFIAFGNVEVAGGAPQDRRFAGLPLSLRTGRAAQQVPSGALAFHSDDIEYVFGTLDTRPGAVWQPEDRKLSEQMMSYWTNFAKTRRSQWAGAAGVAEV